MELEERLEKATSAVQTAKQTNEFATELEEWDNALNRYQEAYYIANQEDFPEKARIKDHVQTARTISSRLSGRKEIIDLIENANSLMNSGKELLEDDSEDAMETYVEAGKLYFDAAKIARDRGFKEKKTLREPSSKYGAKFKKLRLN